MVRVEVSVIKFYVYDIFKNFQLDKSVFIFKIKYTRYDSPINRDEHREVWF